ncbi:MAG: chorismate-binding protein [Verrucomicrobiales bacterium]|nr:chorismate-binding protein [Verrucomicrobiales bacterium]
MSGTLDSTHPVRPLHRKGEDLLWMDLGGGRMVRGWGPFEKSETAPVEGWAFYVNDFDLGDPKPWLIPQDLDFECLGACTERASPPARDWQKPDPEQFRDVFEDIAGKLVRKSLRKAVPVVADTCAWPEQTRWDFLEAFPHLEGDPGTHGYACSMGTRGFAGRTPELLFHLEGGKLHTMALAGTVPSGDRDTLQQHPKLLHEHELVVEVLLQRLGTLGSLTVLPRRLLDLGTMTHLCTKLEVTLDDPQWEQRGGELIRLLHPTPALGIAPRNRQTLALLKSYRKTLKIPPHFGAPFGVKWPGGMLFLVAIRGIFWENEIASLPAGCGIVSGSSFESEWAELELKRQWVRRALGL